MRTKRGYIELSNGYVNWYFIYKPELAEIIGEAIASGDVEVITNLASLKVDCETGMCIESKYPNSVRSALDLQNIIKLMSVEN